MGLFHGTWSTTLMSQNCLDGRHFAKALSPRELQRSIGLKLTENAFGHRDLQMGNFLFLSLVIKGFDPLCL